MSGTHAVTPLQVFRGDRTNAAYRTQPVPAYVGNPLIEALPDILQTENAIRSLAHYPLFDPQDRKHSGEIRMHFVQQALRFFEPLPAHIDLEQRISHMLRDGYIGRNPAERDHWRELDRRADGVARLASTPLRSSAASGFSIIGIPGVGKTTGTERILQLYPQVIQHGDYHGLHICRTQIVWLKLTCPYDGSVKGLCIQFFLAIDDLLGTDYSQAFAGSARRTVDEMIPAMARVAWIHCLGVLVIDEIQHVSHAKSGGADRMLSFFLQLINVLGLPVLMIGTPAALPVLSRELRQIRRSSGQGDLIWERMPNDDVWRLFLESLWRYQYVREPVALDDALADTLFDESQGITDFAVKLFLLAQIRAITTGGERLTAGIVRSVGRDSLRLAQPVLRALRTGDTAALASMADIHPIDMNSAIRDTHRSRIAAALANNAKTAPHGIGPMVKEAETTLDVVQPANTDPAPSDAKPSGGEKPRQRSAHKEATPSKCLLVRAGQKGKAQGTTAHEGLAQSGYIASINSMTGTSAHP